MCRIAFFTLSLAALILFTSAGKATSLYCWGRNDYGQLGTGNTTEYHIPTLAQAVTDAGLNPLQSSGGWYHNCVLNENGTVWCWGGGPLGSPSVSQSYTPVEVVKADDSALTGVVKVSSGGPSVCALTELGTVYCWGGNSYGQLGDGTSTDKSYAVSVIKEDGQILTGIIRLAFGDFHVCALAENSTAWCWGRNYEGQLGNGTAGDIRTFAGEVLEEDGSALTGAVRISSGAYHTCVVKSDGTVWCWGANGYGQLGDGTTTDRPFPVQVKKDPSSFLDGIVDVSAGAYQTCALAANGTVWCWGRNDYGQIGSGSSEEYVVYPEQVRTVEGSALTDVSEISEGCYHFCALTNNGTVWCWGHNGYGQIGDGTTTQRNLAVNIGFSADRLWSDGCSMFSCAVTGLATLEVSPETLIFTRPYESRTVTVSPSGVIITSIDSSDPSVFQIKNNLCIGSGSDCTFEVVFRPEALIDYSGVITINYGSDSKTIPVEARLSDEAESPVACAVAEGGSAESRDVDRAFLIIIRKGSCVRE